MIVNSNHMKLKSTWTLAEI